MAILTIHHLFPQIKYCTLVRKILIILLLPTTYQSSQLNTKCVIECFCESTSVLPCCLYIAYVQFFTFHRWSKVMIFQSNVFLRGLMRGFCTRSIHPLLSSNMVQLAVRAELSDYATFSNSLSSSISRTKFLIDWDSAIYSLSIVDREIFIWSFEHHMIGQFIYAMI